MGGQEAGADVAGLSGRQAAILEAIRRAIAAHGVGPTVREITAACGLASTSAAAYQLARLEELGYIRRNRAIARGIVLADPAIPSAREVVAVPVVGHIAAGEPIPVPDDLAVGEFAETVGISGALLPGRRDGLFALRVRGHSMVDALIADGDIVLLRHAETCENGETVAVWLKAARETTLKKFYREGDRVRLQPANATMGPIYADPADVEIQGTLVGVLRRVA
jgi:repressor LexA